MNVRLKHHMTWTAGVYYGGQMRMNHYTATLYMTTNSTDPANHNTAFERIKYFVYNELDSTIFINSDEQDQCRLFVEAGLNVTTMPGDPVDQLIGIMLYYKLDAVMEGQILMDEVEISSVMGENMIYLHSENENANIVSIPDWWTSPDPVHCDSNLVNGDKVLKLPYASAWRELDLTWTADTVDTDTGNIVVFADFKPSDDTK